MSELTVQNLQSTYVDVGPGTRGAAVEGGHAFWQALISGQADLQGLAVGGVAGHRGGEGGDGAEIAEFPARGICMNPVHIAPSPN